MSAPTPAHRSRYTSGELHGSSGNKHWRCCEESREGLRLDASLRYTALQHHNEPPPFVVAFSLKHTQHNIPPHLENNHSETPHIPRKKNEEDGVVSATLSDSKHSATVAYLHHAEDCDRQQKPRKGGGGRRKRVDGKKRPASMQSAEKPTVEAIAKRQVAQSIRGRGKGEGGGVIKAKIENEHNTEQEEWHPPAPSLLLASSYESNG